MDKDEKRLDRPQWITPPFAAAELNDKKVFARFVIKDGSGYEGVGIIRARTRPPVDSLAAIELVFTRRDSPYQFTDMVFFLTAAQAAKLKRVEGKDYDFEFEGLLEPSRSLSLKAELQQRLDRIDELKTQIDSLRPFDAQTEQLIERRFRLDWNYNSNAIEGNQVSRGETEIFLDRGLTAKGKPFKDYLDIKGHDEAIAFLKDVISRKEPLTEASLRELHKVLLVKPYTVGAETPDGKPTTKVVQIGEYKSEPNHVRTRTGAIHYYSRPEETPAQMGDLMNWYRKEIEAAQLHPVLIASIFHHRFTAIHPFDDGNGRMARLLMNLILMQSHLPPAVLRFEKRDEYIFALEKADQGDTSDLIAQIADEVTRSLETLLRGAKGEAIEEPDDIDKEIALLKQQLQHIEDPVEFSESVQRKLFAESLGKFLIDLGSKISFFDEFYSTHSVRIQGDSRQGTTSRGWSSESELQTKDIAAELERLRGQHGVITTANFIFEWQNLKKSPLSDVNDSLQITLQFQQLNYTIAAPTVPYTIKHTYNAALTEKEMNGFIAAVCRKLMATIQTSIKSQLSP